VTELSNKFEVLELELTRRVKELLRSYKSLRKDTLSVQKRLGESVTSKDLEMGTDMVRAELEDQIQKNSESITELRQIVKAQKFETESDILKKLKSLQSEHESKLEDYYKFKADLYGYLDNKHGQL